jgi:hypothetical protein
MTPDLGRITDQINAIWDSYALLILLAGAVAAVVVAVLATRALLRRGAKQVIGFGVVQAGVTVAVITGVHDFFYLRLNMPVSEAVILAIFIEAAVWGAVGFIVAHARRGGVGFGDAGPFFAFAQAGGGLLAVLGSTTAAAAIGRVVIVGFGAYMWYLQLLQVVTRTGKRSRWRWTPKRLLLAVGAIAPEDADVEDEHREWQVRRLARAMRWANARWPWSWLGGRALAHRAETTTADVLAEARRRFADAWVTRQQARVDSDTMAAVIAEAVAAAKWSAGQPPVIHRTLVRPPGGQLTDSLAEDDRPMPANETGQPAAQARSTRRSAKRSSRRQKTVERAAEVVAREPDISGPELLKRLKLTGQSERTGRRLKGDAEAWLTTSGATAVSALTAPAASNGYADIDPATVAAMAAQDDRP